MTNDQDNIHIGNSIICDENGHRFYRCHITSSTNENWNWVGGIISERFSDPGITAKYIDSIGVLTQSNEPIRISQSQMRSFAADSKSLNDFFDQFAVDEQGSIIAYEDDFLVQRAEDSDALDVLRLLATAFPDYGKNIVKIVTDPSTLTVKKDLTMVVSHLKNFKPFLVQTKDVVTALQAWRNFLLKYQNGLIPGLLPSDKLKSWVCVPRDQVKEAYLAELEGRNG